MSALKDKIFSSKATTIVLAAALVVVIGGGVIGVGAGGAKPEREAAAQESAKPAPKSEIAAPEPAAAAESPAPKAEDEGESVASSAADDSADDQVADAAPDKSAATPSADFGATTVEEARADPVRLASAADARGANSFNRLMKKPTGAPNAPPARDGIHDPTNPGTELLQWPSVAFEGLPKTADGNKVDWVKALQSGKISPRYRADDPKAEPFLLDLVIVRQVKGSMPNVVYPHLQHTQWLDCSNCHDEIFIPQKGANQISMAGILLGQKCGVCHGKVAFPVSDCRRCHSQPKTEEELRALADRSNWSNGGKGDKVNK